MTSWIAGLFASGQRSQLNPSNGASNFDDGNNNGNVSWLEERRKEQPKTLEKEEEESEAARPPYLHVSKHTLGYTPRSRLKLSLSTWL